MYFSTIDLSNSGNPTLPNLYFIGLCNRAFPAFHLFKRTYSSSFSSIFYCSFIALLLSFTINNLHHFFSSLLSFQELGAIMCSVVVDGNKAANAFFKERPSANVEVRTLLASVRLCTSLVFNIMECQISFLRSFFDLFFMTSWCANIAISVLSIQSHTHTHTHTHTCTPPAPHVFSYLYLLLLPYFLLLQAAYTDLEQVAWDLKTAQMEAGVDFPVHLSREAGGLVRSNTGLLGGDAA